MNFGAFSKATELKKRLWFTLGALIIYRLGTYIPLPGINPAVLQDIFRQNQGGILGMFDMFAGGALSRMTIFALNIMPYISASIIMQLMSAVSPKLEALKKEGEAGRKKINQYTRYGTVLIAALQAYGISAGLEGMSSSAGPAVAFPGAFFKFQVVVTLVGGTIFLMWLGEQITARGVGNGISLIIFAGIVANLPSALAGTTISRPYSAASRTVAATDSGTPRRTHNPTPVGRAAVPGTGAAPTHLARSAAGATCVSVDACDLTMRRAARSASACAQQGGQTARCASMACRSAAPTSPST